MWKPKLISVQQHHLRPISFFQPLEKDWSLETINRLVSGGIAYTQVLPELVSSKEESLLICETLEILIDLQQCLP
jgi:hypothetical protein